ncbi:uncharacterized protein N7500_004416 [Penicillium coprophilum]|uniref:uncharacterized protein n=1 Tax=Penicillium coprophilum TaxID=36646 RepID=UPI00238D4A58|nr:uncharacterized protein N7500_004416 [Penicillium coprophilum]KAJ5162586.1 hypothetical protein N7500_004416 [Penicillium coprophilum]
MPRRAIPTSEKIALREYRRNNTLLSNKQLAQWFQQTYNHCLSPSTISEILSSRYCHLDDELSKHQLSAKRTRIAKWPELEKALIHWVKLAENHIPITQEVILMAGLLDSSTVNLYETGYTLGRMEALQSLLLKL